MTTIRRATADDLSAVARTASRAFASDPVMRWLFPDDDEYEGQHQTIFGNFARRWLATDTLWCTDDIAALAGWNPPGRPEIELDDVVEYEHPEWRIERFLALREQLATNTPPEHHWHLNLLATHPDWQRRGLGGAMMATVFEIADDEGLPCYLETETAENVSYYRHHGFAVRSEWDVPLDGPHMWGMLRSVDAAAR